MNISPHTVYAGIDWLTVTTGPDDDAQTAYERCRALAVEQQDAGDKLKPWSSHGYRGFGLPHLRCGVRDGDTLVELSGHLADRYWREFLPWARNVTRIDPQVTCTYSHQVDDLAVQAYHAPAVEVRPGLPPIRKAIFQEANGGQTLYLGAPSSARRARLYDKHAESRGEYPPNTWRWELQVRSPMGSDHARLIDGSNDVCGAVASLVHGFFSGHGVAPWFKSDGAVVFSPARVARRDMSRWLDWIRSGVRPGVRRWSDRAGRAVILEALGMTEGDE